MTTIAEFYAGRSIFVTGATGFMGKVLVEKLLRSCPQVCMVYLLIRPKKGQQIKERLEDLVKAKLFDQLHEAQPNFAEKLHAIQGDILEEALGVKESDVELLANCVSVVFHSAATVKFDEPLKLSIQMNVLGVRKIVALSKRLPKLEALVHVSTAYANCDREVIMETVYTPPHDPAKVIESIQWMDEEVVDEVTPLIIKPRPNTYTYTKAMAESILLQERGLIPTAIVRPSIVGATWRDPFPGWVDNFNGPTGMLAAIGKGVLRVMHGYREGAADIIPVDIATHLMIAVGWSVAMERPNNVPVYNCTTGQLNRQTWGECETASYEYFMKHPLNAPFRVPDPKFTNSRIYRNVHLVFDHLLPAWIMDFLLWVQGKKPMLTRFQKRLWRSVKTLEYFTSRQWVFSNQNVLDLLEKMSAEDQKEFDFDVTHIKWPAYMENYCIGVKKYALNEDMSTIDLAKQALQRLLLFRRVFYVLITVVGWKLLMKYVPPARRAWYTMIAYMLGLLRTLPVLRTLPGLRR